MNFIDRIKERARSNKKTIVLPETGDIRTLEAADIILKEKIADLILVGNKDEITKNPKFDLKGASFMNPGSYERSGELISDLYELRKAKGMTEAQAKDLVTNNPLYFSVMLVYKGIADGMVAGAEYSTADVLRPALQILKTAEGIKIVSSMFIMCVPDCEYGNDGIFVFSDCGLNQNPGAAELAEIAVSSAKSYKTLVGEEPVVAMLSHSSLGSAKHADVDKVLEATKIAKEKAPEFAIDGEFQLDTAIIPEIGIKKAPGNPVAGKANVLIFPDLDSGNIGYKLVERLAKAQAYGPVLQGIKKPVNDLSRGCSSDDIVGVTAITAVQAQG